MDQSNRRVARRDALFSLVLRDHHNTNNQHPDEGTMAFLNPHFYSGAHELRTSQLSFLNIMD
jgi:hypothetical protein